MKQFLAVLALAFPVHAAFAGEIDLPSGIVDAAMGDWNKDGRADLALLSVTDEDNLAIGLTVFFRDQRDPDYGLLEPVLTVPNAFWGTKDNQYGREPTISALANGSFAVTERNYAAGREHWEAQTTVAWRDDRFIVAGYAFDYFDTVQEYEPLHCELNLLTGKGTINDRPATFEARKLMLDDWTKEAGENPGLKICRGR